MKWFFVLKCVWNDECVNSLFSFSVMLLLMYMLLSVLSVSVMLFVNVLRIL